MGNIFIAAVDQVRLMVTADEEGIERELSDHFTFLVPGYKYMPAYKRGIWDGKIRLYSKTDGFIYRGLLKRIVKFAKDRGYDVTIGDSVYQADKFTRYDLQEFLTTLQLPPHIIPRDYQIDSILECRNKKRLTLLSPTGSGKSFIIYALARWIGVKTLIIVPNKGLVHQMASDFTNEYGYKDEVHKIYSGKEKNTDAMISVTTWQSIFRISKDWFDQFACVIVDETHLAKAKSLTGILEKMESCAYRFGTTGTLDGTETNKLVIEGLLGPVFHIVTTKNLIEKGVLASFSIRAAILKHPRHDCEAMYKADYQKEVDFTVSSLSRNVFIRNLVTKIQGNNLVLVQYVEKHGDVLYEMISQATKRPVYYIHGGIPAEEREIMRKQIEKEKDAIIIATTGTLSTGVNIVKLNNIFFAHPNKSRIMTLQSIGRVLRKSKTKTHAVLFDIVDDLTYKDKQAPNFSLRHFMKRVDIYKSERFPFKISKVKLENKK